MTKTILTIFVGFAIIIVGMIVVFSRTSSQHKSSLDLTASPTPTTTATSMQTDAYATPTSSPTTSSPSPVTQQTRKEPMSNAVTLQTSKGNIEIQLYPEDAPGTVTNFLDKARSGYYKNLTFHRVEDWVIQGGDPSGNGTGGGKIPTELSQRAFVEGSVGVARGGDIKVSNDSQFFICTTDCSWLTGQYTNFGTVTKGMDVAKSIAVGDKILGITAK